MDVERNTSLTAHGLGVRVPGRTLVEGLDLDVRPGEFLAILGRNGTGKTLTMHTLAGLRPPDDGDISLAGSPLASLPRRDVARRLALLPQHVDDVFPTTVFETVLVGRHPHVPPMQWETREDREIASAALAAVDLDGLASRDVLTLSGGERRRLAVAQVLAQAPDVYLLDEPTNHLDPRHQLDVLQLFRGAADNGAAIAATLHDANLAARFAHRCLLLFGDGRWAEGPVDEVLDESSLEELYETEIEAVDWRSGRLFVATSDRN